MRYTLALISLCCCVIFVNIFLVFRIKIIPKWISNLCHYSKNYLPCLISVWHNKIRMNVTIYTHLILTLDMCKKVAMQRDFCLILIFHKINYGQQPMWYLWVEFWPIFYFDINCLHHISSWILKEHSLLFIAALIIS